MPTWVCQCWLQGRRYSETPRRGFAGCLQPCRTPSENSFFGVFEIGSKCRRWTDVGSSLGRHRHLAARALWPWLSWQKPCSWQYFHYASGLSINKYIHKMNNSNKPNRAPSSISADQEGSLLTLSHLVWFYKPVNHSYQTSKFKLFKNLLLFLFSHKSEEGDCLLLSVVI